MRSRIGVNAAPERVFAFLRDPANARHWLAHLRHEADGLPEPGLEADEGAMAVRWSAEPRGEMTVHPLDDAAEVRIAMRAEEAPSVDPTEDESPRAVAASGLDNALRSIKSHVEAAAGGDPEEPTADAPTRAYGRSATQDPDV